MYIRTTLMTAIGFMATAVAATEAPVVPTSPPARPLKDQPRVRLQVAWNRSNRRIDIALHSIKAKPSFCQGTIS